MRSGRVVVVGAGLLGGSLLAALQTRRVTPGREGGFVLVAVSGGRTLEGLRARDWCDELFPYERLEEACDEADLVLLCSPLGAILEHLARISAARDRLSRGAVVSDVGSTKTLVCTAGFEAFADEGEGTPRFVGGHPMAGSERSGLEAADPLLYQSALWVLCPPHDLPERQDGLLREIVHACGARAATLDPWIHDAAVARISHVPQLVASTLSAWAGGDEALAEPALALAAGGFRDMTRLALSRWEVWRDIVATNPGPVSEALAELSERLATLSGAAARWREALEEIALSDDPEASTRQWFAGIAGGDVALAASALGADSQALEKFGEAEAALRAPFEDGAAFRRRFRMPRKGICHDLSEFVVRLEDRPGQMLAVLQPLAREGVNVQDLEILKVREGESGTVLLGFATPEEAARAREILVGAHFLVMDR